MKFLLMYTCLWLFEYHIICCSHAGGVTVLSIAIGISKLSVCMLVVMVSIAIGISNNLLITFWWCDCVVYSYRNIKLSADHMLVV